MLWTWCVMLFCTCNVDMVRCVVLQLQCGHGALCCFATAMWTWCVVLCCNCNVDMVRCVVLQLQCGHGALCCFATAMWTWCVVLFCNCNADMVRCVVFQLQCGHGALCCVATATRLSYILYTEDGKMGLFLAVPFSPLQKMLVFSTEDRYRPVFP